MKKTTKVSSEVSRFKILRGIVIALQDQYDRRELASVPTKRAKARLDRARKELQDICRHERVAELMSRWSPPKLPKASLIYSNGRICLDCGFKELNTLRDLDVCLYYSYGILHEPSFFADFSELEKFTEFGGIEKQNLLKYLEKSTFVFRSLEDFVEKNSQKNLKP